MSRMRYAWLAAAIMFAAMAAGCTGMRVLHATQPVMMGAMPEGPQGRIALHVSSDLREFERKDIQEGLRRKFQQQLATSGFQVIDVAQAGKQDLVLRADIRYRSQTDTVLLTVLSIFSAFIVPISSTEEFVIDTTLIRAGEMLGTSRQAIRARQVTSLLPFGLLYGPPPSAALYEEHIELNRALLSAATTPAGKGI